MTTLTIISVIGLVLSILKVMTVLIIFGLKNEIKNWDWSAFGWNDDWDRKIIGKSFSSFLLELGFVFTIWFAISRINLIDENLTTILVGILTTAVSIGWGSLYLYSIIKFLYKFSNKI